MSKKKGTAEKLLKPLHRDGQNAFRFTRRVAENLRVAWLGAFATKRYAKARRIHTLLTAMVACKSPPEGRENNADYMLRKKLLQKWERKILAYIEEVFKKRDGNTLRKLADVLENADSIASPDVDILVMYCYNKPRDYVFTFKELLQARAEFLGLKPPYDEAVEKRVRRLITMLGIKVRKGQ